MKRFVFLLGLALSCCWGAVPSATAQYAASELRADEPVVEESSLILSDAENARFLKSDILEVAALLPEGATISVAKEVPPQNYDYRDEKGVIRRSSNGFYRVRLAAVPAAHEKHFPAARIDELNALPGGLFISASAVNSAIGEPMIQPLKPANQPGSGFLNSFTAEGQPRFSYTSTFQKRFGGRLNLAIPASDLGAGEQRKWERIFAELQRVSDRTVLTDGILLFIETDLAREYSILFEQKGIIQPQGAWTIAVKATAPRHGFGNVPCAEFVSEVLRQAYRRAGYEVTEDFNSEKGNRLIWDQTAAVVNLTTALFKAGWIPWETAKYRPPTGAPIMHATARTPGHAYVAAGLDGRFIMDNGSPRGRDLMASSDKVIKLMYLHGVFFLPPGVIPQPW